MPVERVQPQVVATPDYHEAKTSTAKAKDRQAIRAGRQTTGAITKGLLREIERRVTVTAK